MRRLRLALAIALPLGCVGGEASAVETATPCSPTNDMCEAAPIAFSREATLPIQGGFDTGWVPSNSNLQVKLFAELYASTKIDMAGQLVTSWPDVLKLQTPGTPGSGTLAIHYGLNVGADAKLHISVLGQSFDWTGPIPYTPQFDFQVDATHAFDPWAFDGVEVDGSTMKQKLAQVSAKSFIGVNIPGLDGGFELDTQMDLKANYQTTRMVITDVNGEPVVGGAILAEDGATLASYLGGPSVELDVHPAGRVSYAGTIHLIPSFYISTIGPSFSIPIVDIPIPFDVSQDDWVFDSVRVHVPLPDIFVDGDPDGGALPPDQTSFDLGMVGVGEQSAKKISMRNDGEARLDAQFSSSDPEHFTLSSASSELDPTHAFDELVIFSSTEPGEFSATITIASNDPDEPARTFQVTATAAAGAVAAPPEVDTPTAPDDDGCGCRVASKSASPIEPSAPLGMIFGAVGLASLARRSRARSEAAKR